MNNCILKLYITGQTSKAERAIKNLRKICEEIFGDQYEMKIVDVLENPQQAEDEKILATPTLIKEAPPPPRRVIGDLSDRKKVVNGLEIRASKIGEKQKEIDNE